MLINKTPTLDQFMTLTKPQRQALIEHLRTWARRARSEKIRGAVGRMAERILTGTPTAGPSSDLEVIALAVFLDVRSFLSDRTLSTVKRAWAALGFSHDWACDGFDQRVTADQRVRAILDPAPVPVVVVPNRRWVIRVVTHSCGGFDQSVEAVLDAFVALGLFRLHRRDHTGACFDIMPPRDTPDDLTWKAWADKFAAVLSAQGANAVAAPEFHD